MSKEDAKVWLVTGSSTGFGRYIAEHLLESGEKVVATARRTDKIAVLKQKGNALILPLDVIAKPLKPRRRISAGSTSWSTMPASASSERWKKPRRRTRADCSK